MPNAIYLQRMGAGMLPSAPQNLNEDALFIDHMGQVRTYGISGGYHPESVFNVKWKPIKGPAYTIQTDDAERFLETEVACTITVPPHSIAQIPRGTQIVLCRAGTGVVSITAGIGVDVRSAESRLTLTSQFSVAHLLKRDENVWYLSGDLTV